MRTAEVNVLKKLLGKIFLTGFGITIVGILVSLSIAQYYFDYDVFQISSKGFMNLILTMCVGSIVIFMVLIILVTLRVTRKMNQKKRSENMVYKDGIFNIYQTDKSKKIYY